MKRFLLYVQSIFSPVFEKFNYDKKCINAERKKEEKKKKKKKKKNKEKSYFLCSFENMNII